jgi:hypothetical protein
MSEICYAHDPNTPQPFVTFVTFCKQISVFRSLLFLSDVRHCLARAITTLTFLKPPESRK